MDVSVKICLFQLDTSGEDHSSMFCAHDFCTGQKAVFCSTGYELYIATNTLNLDTKGDFAFCLGLKFGRT